MEETHGRGQARRISPLVMIGFPVVIFGGLPASGVLHLKEEAG